MQLDGCKWWEPPLCIIIIISLFSFEVGNWKGRMVDSLYNASALCFSVDTSSACPLNHWQLLPLSPPSQVILIKSVSLAWKAKIIGEGFWMPFTLNDACFFPFSQFFSSPTASLTPPPSLPLRLLAKSYLSFSSFPFSLLLSYIQMWNMD